jgi:hypothetical protein
VMAAVLAIALLGADGHPTFEIGGGWSMLGVPSTTNEGRENLALYAQQRGDPTVAPTILVFRDGLGTQDLDAYVTDYVHQATGMDPNLLSERVTRCTLPTWKVTFTLSTQDAPLIVERIMIGFGKDAYVATYTRPTGTRPDNDAEGAMRGFCRYK